MRKFCAWIVAAGLFSSAFIGVGHAYRSTFTATGATVSTAATVLAANTRRNYLFLHNTSGTVIFCKFGSAASLGDGSFVVPATSGNIIFDTAVDQRLLSCASSGSVPLIIIEGIQPTN